MSAKPEAAEDGAAKAPAKSKKMLIIIVGSVLVLALGGGGAFFYISKQRAAAAEEGEDAPSSKSVDQGKPGIRGKVRQFPRCSVRAEMHPAPALAGVVWRRGKARAAPRRAPRFGLVAGADQAR